MGRENDFSPRALPHPSRLRASWVTGHSLYLEESKVTLKETVLLISGLLALSRFCVLPLHPSDFFLTVPLKKQQQKNHLPLTRSLEHTVVILSSPGSSLPRHGPQAFDFSKDRIVKEHALSASLCMELSKTWRAVHACSLPWRGYKALGKQTHLPFGHKWVQLRSAQHGLPSGRVWWRMRRRIMVSPSCLHHPSPPVVTALCLPFHLIVTPSSAVKPFTFKNEGLGEYF